MAIIVVNKYKHKKTNKDVYIGRGSPLGNPYTSIKNKKTLAEHICDSREESISKYETYLRNQIELHNKNIIDELNSIYKKAKKSDVYLICFCKPKKCHGDIIKKIIDEKL